MLLELNDFEKIQTEHKQISLLRHKNSRYELICKEVFIKNGIDEINNYKKLNAAAINCVPQMLGYEILNDKVLIYLTKLNGYTLDRFYHSSYMMDNLLDRFELVFENAIECVKSLHQAGLIHRDIKPENVIVDDQSRVFLIDFGIATSKNCISQMAGTSIFMSPEAIFMPSEVDESSDYFSLGMTIKHVLGDNLNGVSQKNLERIVQMCEVQKKNRKIF